MTAGGFGWAYRDNFAALGAYRFQAPQSFRSLPATPFEHAAVASLGTGAERSNGPIVAFYGDGKTSMIAALGHHEHFFDPAGSLAADLRALTENGTPLVDAHPVDPGPRGGRMSCGTVRLPTFGESGACAWVDGSMSVAYFEARTDITVDQDQLAAHAREFRDLAEVPD
ncbi:hypothetical protein [Kitasatospora paranensis]|uniref:Uncharacterized protein n=1 Tax=Kitasatospora paranensis TaxID=258053 RepID=A0ABW2G2S9_9ACTN